MIVFSSAQARLHAARHAHVAAQRPRWAVRPLAAGERSPLLVAGARTGRAGLSVRWRPADRLACSATMRFGRSEVLPSRMHGRERRYRASNNLRQRGSLESQCSAVKQPLKALASCGTTWPGAKASQASAPVAQRSGMACRSEQWFIAAGPNPSIEGTSTSGLRPLVAAPHVKR